MNALVKACWPMLHSRVVIQPSMWVASKARVVSLFISPTKNMAEGRSNQEASGNGGWSSGSTHTCQAWETLSISFRPARSVGNTESQAIYFQISISLVSLRAHWAKIREVSSEITSAGRVLSAPTSPATSSSSQETWLLVRKINSECWLGFSRVLVT